MILITIQAMEEINSLKRDKTNVIATIVYNSLKNTFFVQGELRIFTRDFLFRLVKSGRALSCCGKSVTN